MNVQSWSSEMEGSLRKESLMVKDCDSGFPVVYCLLHADHVP